MCQFHTCMAISRHTRSQSASLAPPPTPACVPPIPMNSRPANMHGNRLGLNGYHCQTRPTLTIENLGQSPTGRSCCPHHPRCGKRMMPHGAMVAGTNNVNRTLTGSRPPSPSPSLAPPPRIPPRPQLQHPLANANNPPQPLPSTLPPPPAHPRPLLLPPPLSNPPAST